MKKYLLTLIAMTLSGAIVPLGAQSTGGGTSQPTYTKGSAFTSGAGTLYLNNQTGALLMAPAGGKPQNFPEGSNIYISIKGQLMTVMVNSSIYLIRGNSDTLNTLYNKMQSYYNLTPEQHGFTGQITNEQLPHSPDDLEVNLLNPFTRTRG